MTGLRRIRLGRAALIVVMAAVFLAIPREEPALGLGTETIGSDRPVAEQEDWAKGVIAVVDLDSRVYSRWVNGNANFYYRGGTEELNATLRDFAAVEADVREVVLRPGPGEARTFDGVRIQCDWQVHVPGGLYLVHAKQEKGTQVFARHATMTIFVSGGNIELKKLQIPAGVTVLELRDLVGRYLAGLKNEDHDVRGYAAYLLGTMDPYVEEIILPLVEMLKDENGYVRRCAANALGGIGARGLVALPTLRQGLQDENENVRQAFREAIAKIEGAEGEEAKEHRAVREQIHKFRARNRPLAQADAAIREGLVELAKKFPQLEKARDWEEVTSKRSEAGRIGIWLAHSDQGKARTSDEPVPEAERYSLSVFVQRGPSRPARAGPFPIYPNLGLVGQVGASAGDPQLEGALKKLVADALAPLKELNDKAAPDMEGSGGDRAERISSTEQTRYIKAYEAEGIAIEAGFIPDETQIILGQPLFITFTVTNRSHTPYGFFVGGDSRGSVRHNNFRITAVDADGNAVKDPYSYNNFGGMGQDIALERGQVYSERLFLGHWCAFDKPGVYTVTCKRILETHGEEPRNKRVPVSISFELTVAPFDARRMQEVIHGLGKSLRDGEEQGVYEASLALAAIPDEQVVAHLAVSLTKGDYQNKLPAIRGLAQFSSDAAADALLMALKDPDHAVRDAGGDALREIKRVDRALQVLIPETSHESASIRALAARALGATKHKDALEVLLKALRDPEPGVRCAAAIALGALGHREALQALRQHVEGNDMGMRVAASKGLRALGESLQPEWLTPVIRSADDINDQNFHEAIRLIRLYGGEQAAPALVSCLDFDDPSPRNTFNMFLILAIHHSPGGPQYYYKFHSDPNTDGTPEEIEGNRQILAELRKWLQDRE